MADIQKLEKELWEAADNLRTNSKLTNQQYRMLVLGLFFLRCAWGCFKMVDEQIKAKRVQLIGRQIPIEPDDYAKRGAKYLPPESRYDFLVILPEDEANIGKRVNDAMTAIEKVRLQLSSMLPHDYTELDNDLLRETLRIFNNPTLDEGGDDILGRIYKYCLGKFPPAASSDDGDDSVVDKEKLLARVTELLAAIEAFLDGCGFDLGELLRAGDFERLAKVRDGADAVSDSDEKKQRFGIMAREHFKLCKFVEKGDVDGGTRARRNAIDAISKQLTKRRDVADTGRIMVQLQHIVDSHVTMDDIGDKESARFAISKIDFELLHREFEGTPHSNLLVDDLRDAIGHRLEAALRNNPRRADCYEQYQRIIDKRNREQDRVTIEAKFEALMKLSEELPDEEQRFVREGFTNEWQPSVFDMLYKNDLVKGEIEQISRLSCQLVDKIQKRLSQMVRWTEKPKTRSDVKTLIRDELYQSLPMSHPDESILAYRDESYEFFYSRAAQGIARRAE